MHALATRTRVLQLTLLLKLVDLLIYVLDLQILTSLTSFATTTKLNLVLLIALIPQSL